MKSFFCFLLLLPLLACSQRSHYYISSSYKGANGSSNGSINRPFTTWSQVLNLLPGDSVFFKRGDIFPFTSKLTIKQSGTATNPIYIGAYGTGKKPVLSGLTRLLGWTSYGGGIWYISSAIEPKVMLVDGIITGKGRYPKSSYRIYTSGSSNITSITDADLPSSPSWIGATIIIRGNNGQKTPTFTVTSQDNGVIGFNGTLADPKSGNGYFFTNDMKCLTSYGDWMYDANAQRIYMYLGNDTTRRIEVARDLDELIFSNKNYITIQNLTIEGATGTGVKFKSNKFNVLDNCEVRYCWDGTGLDGGTLNGVTITKEGATDNTYTNNFIHDIVNCGARAYITCPRLTYKYNTFENIGMILGTGETGTVQGMGMYLLPDSVVVQYNRFINIGFMPIYFRRSKTYIKNNYINGFSFTKDDTGGIYVWTSVGEESNTVSDRYIQGNIIMNGQSKTGASNNGMNFRASGIYTDLADHVIITDNIILNVSGYGLFIHQSSSNIVKNNIVYSAGRAGANFEENNTTRNPLANTEFSNNIIITENAPFIKFTRKLSSSEAQFGTFASNYYRNSVATGVMGSGTNIKLGEWQKKSGLDLNSIYENGNGKEIRVEYNETNASKVIDLDSGNYRNLKTNAIVTGKITLQPYTGVALLYISGNRQ